MSDAPTFEYAGRPLVFTFLDRQVAYDCESCDARCCKVVPGVFVNRDQEALLTRLDSGAAVSSIGEHRFYVQFNERCCPALDPDDRCRIHQEDGRRAKPPVCGLFPFVKLFDAGTFLTASPHLNFICPLTFAGEGSSHAEILEDIEFLHGGRLGAFTPEVLPDEDPVEAELEQRIVGLANDGAAKGGTVAQVMTETGVDGELLARRADAALELLDLPAPEESPELAARLLPLVPSLRPDLFRLPREDLAAALVITARLLAHADTVRAVPLTHRQMAAYWDNRRELLALLAVSHRPVAFGGQEQPSVDRGDDDVSNVLADLIVKISSRPGERTLGEWLRGTPGGRVRQVVLNNLTKATLSFG